MKTETRTKQANKEKTCCGFFVVYLSCLFVLVIFLFFLASGKSTCIASHSQLFYQIYHINLNFIEEKDQKIHNVASGHLIKKSVNASYLLCISLNALHVLILLVLTHKNVENIIST